MSMNEIFATQEFAALLEQFQQRPCEDRNDAWPTDRLTAMTASGCDDMGPAC